MDVHKFIDIIVVILVVDEVIVECRQAVHEGAIVVPFSDQQFHPTGDLRLQAGLKIEVQ